MSFVGHGVRGSIGAAYVMVDIQPLVAGFFADEHVRITAAQGAASEIYVGCSNGELLRFALQADAFYALVSRQTVVAGKAIDDMVIISSQHRALVQSDGQLHFYTVPSLDPIPQNVIRPIRHVVTFAVDHLHLASQSVDFSVVKRRAIVQYTLRDRLYYGKVPLDLKFTACLLNLFSGNTTPARRHASQTHRPLPLHRRRRPLQHHQPRRSLSLSHLATFASRRPYALAHKAIHYRHWRLGVSHSIMDGGNHHRRVHNGRRRSRSGYAGMAKPPRFGL